MCLATNDLWLPNIVSQKTIDKLRTAQRPMERKMWDLKLQDKIKMLRNQEKNIGN